MPRVIAETTDLLPDLLAAPPAGTRLINVRTGVELDASGIDLRADQLAARLAASGLAPGARVVVGEADPLDYLIALLACWRAGLLAVAVNPALAAAEQENVIATTGAQAWLGTTDAVLAAGTGLPRAPEPLDRAAPALILMTSGTTGRPKGIVHSLQGLAARIALNIEMIGAPTLRRTLCVLPVFFGHGLIGNVLTPLWAGGTAHLWPVPAVAELPRLGGYLDDHDIGFMSSVPSFWKLALRLSPPPRRPLERIHVGSAPLGVVQWQQIAQWGGTAQVFNMFGMTEAANWIAGATLAEADSRDGFVGRSWGGRFAVRTDDGRIAPSGRGEVLLQSPSMMLGYFERPDLDAEAFLDGWFRTGDVGELDAEGRLTLVGRIKSEINRGGIKVQAEEIDLLLERHLDIVEACAFGVPDAAAGEAVAAAIVLKAGTPFDPEAIKAWCRTQVRADAVPSKLYALDAIPRNDRGKIVRADVRRLVEAGQ